MVRIGMKVVSGRWKGTIWKLYRDHAISIADDCWFDLKVHPVEQITVVRGIALAPGGDIVRQRIARSWQASDTIH